tara:strand:+ start:198 stop:899 length:702 start_codon:yes stop_codon:yes gene_type:complete
MSTTRKIIIGIVLVIIAILIFRYLFSSSTIISSGIADGKTVSKIPATSDTNSSSNNYSYSVWVYVKDWSYRFGEQKMILGRLDDDNKPSPSISLGAAENNVKVAVECYPEEAKGKSETHYCNVHNIPLQKWVNITISLYSRTLDVYLDGKLVRTCVLPGVPKIANDKPIYISPLGGFSGYTSRVQFFKESLDPQAVYNIYRAGYGGKGVMDSFPYSLKLSFMKDEQEQGSVSI